MRNKSFLTFLILTGLSFAFYSKDVVQKNPETIFLTTEAIKEYDKFKAIIPEKVSVIFKFDLEAPLNLESYNNWNKEVQIIKLRFEEKFDFLTPLDLYTSRNKLEEAILNKDFNASSIKLLKQNSLSFLAIEKESEDFKNLIKAVHETSSFKVSTAGIPYTNYLLDNYSRSIKEKVFPLMFFVSFCFIYLITRSLKSSVLLFLPCLFSATICLSVIKYFYKNMNMVTSIIPLMCFTIVLAMVFHLYFSLRMTGDFSLTIKNKLTPIILMILTTCIGFGSLAISEIQAISDFGKLSSFLIILTCAYGFFFFKFSASFLMDGQNRKREFKKLKVIFHKSLSIKAIVAISILGIGIGSYSLAHIDITTDATKYFPPESKLKESIDSINKSVSGVPLFEVILLETKGNREGLRQLENLELKLDAAMRGTKGYQQLLSLSSMIKEVNKSYSGDYFIPANDLAFHLIRSRLKPAISEAFPLSKEYKISVLGSAIDVDEYEESLLALKSFLSKQNLKYKINGLYYNLMISQKSMIHILFKSFFIALIIVSSIAFLYVRKIKIFFIFLAINIIPVFISFIFMKFFGFSINIATVMTYSIGLGIIVDSSFHLIHSLNQREKLSFDDYFQTTALPILGSSALLIGSFSLFGFNGFLPIKEFGLNLSIILSLGLFFDLYVFPTLILGSSNIKEAFHANV